jgi:hypothetical protein
MTVQDYKQRVKDVRASVLPQPLHSIVFEILTYKTLPHSKL